MKKLVFFLLCIFMTVNCFANSNNDESLYCYNNFYGIHLRIDLDNNYIVVNGNDYHKINSFNNNGKKYMTIKSEAYINTEGVATYFVIFDDASGVYFDLRNAATNEELMGTFKIFCQ